MVELTEHYADALYALSLEQGMPAEHMEQAAYIRDMLQREEYGNFLKAPHSPDEAKRKLLDRLFGDKISDGLMRFLYLTVEKGHEALIVPALTSYLEKGNRHSGKAVASVVSAAPLREEQLHKLQATLSKKLNKQVEILSVVDPSLLGGFCIHVDERLIDCTVKTQLVKMKESLIKGGTA